MNGTEGAVWPRSPAERARPRGARGRGDVLGAPSGGPSATVPMGTSTLSFVLFQSLSRVGLFATPWTAAQQASLSFTISRSLLKLVSIESVMPSNHLVLGRPLLLLP